MIMCRCCGSESGPFDPSREVADWITRESGPDIKVKYPICEDCPDMPSITAFRDAAVGGR